MIRILFCALLCLNAVAAELNEKIVTEWATEVAAGLNAGDSGARLAADFSQERLGELALTPLGLSPQVYADSVAGFAKTPANLQLPGQIAGAIAGGGNYHVLRVYLENKHWHALFRMLQPNGACNYHDFALEDNGAGKPQVHDVYVYATGENFSLTIRNLFVPVLAIGEPGILERVFKIGKDQATLVLDSFNKLPKLRSAGKFKELFEVLDSLPEAVKETKAIQIQRVMAAQNLDQVLYASVMEEYVKKFPADPSIHLINIDRYILAKRFKECLVCIDTIAGILKTDDAWMCTLRAMVHVTSGNLKEARVHIKRAMELEPNLQNVWWAGLEIALKEKDYDTVLDWLGEVKKRFAIEIQDLSKVPAYADFVKSPQYQTWLEREK